MHPQYPNLELIEYKAKQFLFGSEEFAEKLSKIRETNKYAAPDFDATVFPQWWGSTCTGFDVKREYHTLYRYNITKNELVGDKFAIEGYFDAPEQISDIPTAITLMNFTLQMVRDFGRVLVLLRLMQEQPFMTLSIRVTA